MLKKHKAENWQNKPIYLVYKLFKLIILTLNSCCIGYRLSEILLKNLSILHYLLKIGHYSILNDIVIVVLECLLLFGCSINYCITRIFQMVKNCVPIHNLKHLLNQARAGRSAWFLKIDPVRIVCMRACVCVCPRPRLLITSGVMWRDIDLI